MTKYYINSGAVMSIPEKGIKFFNEIFEGLGNQPKILVCNFAQPREDWEKRFEGDKSFFETYYTKEVKPILTLAFPETFQRQVEESDVVYIKGGDDYLIKFWLDQFDLPKIFENKKVATSSASSNVVAKSFWTCDWRKCMDGLGIIPVKVLPHFKSDFGEDDPRGPINWDRAKKELAEYGDSSLPILALEEGDYKVFEI